MTQTVRRPISLTEDQWRKAKSIAALSGLTVSQWVALFIDDGEVRPPARLAKGTKQLADDLAADVDRYRAPQQTLSPAGTELPPQPRPPAAPSSGKTTHQILEAVNRKGK